MKRTLLSLVALVLLGLAASAQAPRGFNYQAVVRNDAGQLLGNHYVSLRLTIRQGATDGQAVYQYEGQIQTNPNGLISLVVGEGSDNYAAIDWGDGPYFLVSEIDPDNGNNYTLRTAQQILSVPYAEYARVADHVSTAFVYDEADPHFHAWAYAYDSLVGAPTTIVWDSVTDKPTAIPWSMITGAPTTIAWDSIVDLPGVLPWDNTTIAWDSVTGKPTTIAWDSITGVPTTIPWQMLTDVPTTIEWDSVTSKPTTIAWDSVTGKPTTIAWDSVTGKPTTIEWDSITGIPATIPWQMLTDVPTTIEWDSVTSKPTTIEWDSVTNKPVTIPWQMLTDVPTTIEWDSVTSKPTTIEWDSVTGKPTTIAWDSVTNKPTTIEWDSVTSKPTTIEWDSVTNKPVTIPWQMLTDVPTTIEWDSVTSKPTTIEWDSVTGKPTTIAWDSVTSKPTTIAWDSVTGKPTTIEWDSVTSKPTTIAWDSVTNKPTTIAWDSVTNKPTTIAWDSVTGTPTLLSQFTNDLHLGALLTNDTLWMPATHDTVDLTPLRVTTLPWSSISGRPLALSQLTNDLALTLGAGDTLYVGDSTQKVSLRPLRTTSLPWTSILYRPTNLSELHNDLQFSLYRDTLFITGDTTQQVLLSSLRTTTLGWDKITGRPSALSFFVNDLPLTLGTDTMLYVGADSAQSVSLKPLVTTTLPWIAITGKPTKLSQFQNDLHLGANLTNDTLFIPTTQDTVDLGSLRTTSLMWSQIVDHPTKLSQFQNDLRTEKRNDTLFIGDSVLLLHRSMLYTHWDSIVARPAWVDTAHFDGTTHTQLQVHNLVNPTFGTDAANKQYVDNRIYNLQMQINELRDSIDSLRAAITAMQHPAVEGALPGRFSISATRKVVFSQGNLQYHPLMNVFRFAEHQYDFTGLDNNNANSKALCAYWLDLFGYGTSTWQGGRERCFMPFETSTNDDEYMVETSGAGNDLTGIYANADWGRYNTIVNGCNQPAQWRTLTKDDWDYLLNFRTNASNLRTMATVAGVRGLILLPDDWELPAGYSLAINPTLSNTNNIFTANQWTVLEQAGAVFLPIAGFRTRSNTTLDYIHAYYWSASHDNATQSTTLHIRTDLGIALEAVSCSQACSVRLVRDY